MQIFWKHPAKCVFTLIQVLCEFLYYFLCYLSWPLTVFPQGRWGAEGSHLPAVVSPAPRAAFLEAARNLGDGPGVCGRGRHPWTHSRPAHSALQHGRHPLQLPGTGGCQKTNLISNWTLMWLRCSVAIHKLQVSYCNIGSCCYYGMFCST